MQITEASQIKIGMKLYGVHALPHNRWTSVDHCTVLSEVYDDETIHSPAFDINGSHAIFDNRVFCRDFNIGAHYNDHRIFTTEKEARQYVMNYENGTVDTDDLTQNSLFED